MNQRSPDSTTPARLSLGLMAVALLSTLAASTCCVLPLILVLVGISGAWMANLAVLKPLTLPLSLLAVVALAWAGYLVFRPTTTINTCTTADNCASNYARMRRLFVVCTLFVGMLLLFPLVAPLFY